MPKPRKIHMPEEHMDKLYNSKNPFVRFVHRGRLEMIVKALPGQNELKILDAGCGEGHLIEELHNKNKKNDYYGIDITKAAIKSAKKRCPYAKLKLDNLLKTGYPDKYFDVVICAEVLEHIPDYKIVVNELKRVLKDNGHLIVTFPNELNWTISRFLLARKPVKVPDHFNSFSPRKMKTTVNLKLVSKVNMPFRLPFFLSLACLMKFKKLSRKI